MTDPKPPQMTVEEWACLLSGAVLDRIGNEGVPLADDLVKLVNEAILYQVKELWSIRP